jgi:hypothetical protein
MDAGNTNWQFAFRQHTIREMRGGAAYFPRRRHWRRPACLHPGRVRCSDFECSLPICIDNEVFVMAKREQVTVPLDRELREFVERVAEREDRSVAGVIRPARRQQQEQAA